MTTRRRRGKAVAGLLVALASVLVLLAIGELVFRWLGHDFSGAVARDAETPVYFRKPRVPLGEVYHRREGPQEWTGNCLSVRLGQLGIVPDPYADDPPITVRYDAAGLRNPPGLDDWEIAVVGDSFTELGHLPDEDLFTTLLAQELGVRVKNLGVANSGPLTELSLLEHFGLAPSTKHVAVMFFGGNDRQDVRAELRFLRRLHETGERFRIELPRQTSLVRALWRLATAGPPRKPPLRDFVHAVFHSADGPLELSIHHAPPVDLEPEVLREIDEGLDHAFDAWAEFTADKDVTVWFFYLPCKLRVYHDLIELNERAPEEARDWRPFDLPGDVRARSEARGFRFVDLTPAFRTAARDEGAFLFNTIYDTHLNRAGSHLVARELARHLGPALSSD